MAGAYHHGDLRRQILDAAAQQIARTGPDALSLRELARCAGVTHGAPAHHFGSRRGLFTALAVEGFHGLAEALAPSLDLGDFGETAVEYVRFALTQPGRYAVMFRADLLDDDPDLQEQRSRAYGALVRGMATVPDAKVLILAGQAQRAAWSTVHGIASLALIGALGDEDPLILARASARQLFG